MEPEWQAVLDRFSYGIYLVTIVSSGKDNGMIASWVTQCSHQPPLISLALRNNRLSRGQITSSKAFCINVLPEASLALLARFKIRDWEHKFDGITIARSLQGMPVLPEAIGFLDCKLVESHLTGDHTIFIAEVIAGKLQHDVPSLTSAQYEGNYRGDT